MKKYILTTMMATLFGDTKAYWSHGKLTMYVEQAEIFTNKQDVKSAIDLMHWHYSSQLEPTIEMID